MYQAEILMRVDFSREPTDSEVEVARDAIARSLKGVTVIRTGSPPGTKRIGIVDAEVMRWPDFDGAS